MTLLGAHSLLANGHVIAAIGTAQMASVVSRVAHCPVVVCCETYKFWERAQSDAFEFNELGDPDAVWKRSSPETLDLSLADWRRGDKGGPLRLLNPAYDVLPPALVSAVVTELGTLPTTSVPVVLRVKQVLSESADVICSTY